MSDEINLKDKIIDAALKNINFDGWSKDSILTGFKAHSIDEKTYDDLFPRGIIDAVLHFGDFTDRQMINLYEKNDNEDLRMPEKIKSLLLVRFEILKPYKEAVRRSIGILALPNNSKLAFKAMYNSTDEIWKAAGDRATDFSFYTKRATLAGIYSSSLMYWLGLSDPDLKNVEQFIDRRLDNVNMIGKFTKPIKDTIKFSFDPLSKFSFFNFNK